MLKLFGAIYKLALSHQLYSRKFKLNVCYNLYLQLTTTTIKCITIYVTKISPLLIIII